MENTLQRFLPIMQRHYPEAKADEIKYFDDGHDHLIFLLPNGVAFRFPREEEYSKKDKIESIFLSEFSRQSPIQIQAFETHTNNEIGTYQTYRFIRGKQLLPEIAKSFSKESMKQIYRQIGSFLKVLHSYPLDKARAIQMDELDPKGYYEFFETIWPKNREILYPLLSEKEKVYLDDAFSKYIATKEQSFVPHVTHNDILPEHIIVDDKKQQLAGMIDFALRIADPARDFMLLHVYGNDFLEEALAAYGKVDSFFLQRRAFYGVNFYVMYLYNAITREDSKEKVEKYKNALSSYIEGSYIPS